MEELNEIPSGNTQLIGNYINYFNWQLIGHENGYYYIKSNEYNKVSRILTDDVNILENPNVLIHNEHIKLYENFEEKLYFKIDNVFKEIKKTKMDNPWSEPFNGDIVIGLEIQKLIKMFSVKHIIETGTSSGISSLFMALENPDINIDTIEIDEKTYNLTKKSFETATKPFEIRTNVLGKLNNIYEKFNNYIKPASNLKIHLGSSTDVLPEILETIGENKLTLFYLDAHWNDYWPLLDEIKLIGKYMKDNAIIVIDDFKVPNRNFGYDCYKNTPCDFNYIKDSLEYVYSDYVYYYNYRSARIPWDARGKIYIIPKKLLDKHNISVNSLYKTENNVNYSII